MRRRLERMMGQYGQTVTLKRRGQEPRETRAFLQPDLKRREALPLTATPLGAVSVQRWRYLGPRDRELAPGDRVAWGGLRLVVQEARAVGWRDETFYQWAVLRPEKEAAE